MYRIVTLDSNAQVRSPEAEVAEPEPPRALPPEPSRPPAGDTRPEAPDPGPPEAVNASQVFLRGLGDPEFRRQLSDAAPIWDVRRRLSDEIRVYNTQLGGLATADGWAFSTWTNADQSDTRWGVGPGALYLGGVSMPLCGGPVTDASDCGFGLPPGRREEYKKWLEVLTGVQQQQHWADLRDRAEAIRKRRNAERDTFPKR